MSLVLITVNVERKTVTEDAGGGESFATSTVYNGLTVTIGYPDKSAVMRDEIPTTHRTDVGPGNFTRSDRVLFLDPWDGTVMAQVNDVIRPQPPITWLPVTMNVVAVRPYYDEGGGGELQLDLEDVI